jgi:5-methylthioadenosine/S-adenosylhomocysteine deaminase
MSWIACLGDASRGTCVKNPVPPSLWLRLARHFSALALALCLAFLLGLGARAETFVMAGSDPAKHVVRGPLVTPEAVLDRELVIEGDEITCVATACAHPSGASVLIVRDAYIYPGLIDAHNHVAYNFLHKWSPPKLYQSRGQWQRTPSYKEFKKPYDALKNVVPCELIKYGELRALISGVTTIQGTSPSRTCFRTLVRNAENQNELGISFNHIRTFILDISSFNSTIDWNVTRSFVVHLAEGIDETSRQEFQTLKEEGLLQSQTAIIHGTAFGSAEFEEMAAVGAKLIWSPQSNLVLYDQTTNIPLALEAGVLVSLGVDWNPSGSNTIFDELRVAAQVNEEAFDGAIPASDWVRMVTTNPAAALGLETMLGSLAPGLKADITVLRRRGDDPNASLLNNHLQDVEMVWIGGELLYGSRAVVDALRPGECEALTVHGARKKICVADTTNPPSNGGQTLAQLKAVLMSHHPGLAPLAP